MSPEKEKIVADILRSRKNKQPEPGFWVSFKDSEVYWTPTLIKERIMKDDNAVKHALLRIYSFQTESEQMSGQTHETNRIGFNANDAEILTSFAEQLKNKGWLSKKQLDLTRKKIVKYSRQLFGYIIDDVLKNLSKDIGAKNVWDLLRYSDYRVKMEEMAKFHVVHWDQIKPFLKKDQIQQNAGNIAMRNLGL